MIELGSRTLRIAFVPQRMHARMALHSGAMVTGVLCATRMGGGSWLTYAGWYVGSFIGFHVILVPLLAVGFAVQNGFERWVRSLVEQELIRFDLQNYDRQLKRLLPKASARPHDDHGPDERSSA